VTTYEVALLFHLVAVIGFFSGVAVAAAAQLGAVRRQRPGEIAAVLGLARTGVLVVGVATLLVLATGLWLIEETGHSLGDGWLSLSLLLLVVAGALGAVGGRKPKQARKLAERQAAAGRGDSLPPDPAIRTLLLDPVSLLANLLSAAAAVAILVLMVWRPS
jgi:uncharacterized membrane protein